MTTNHRVTYVNIQAVPRSGSTLVALLLGAHPAISTIGELDGLKAVNLATYRCSCKQLIQECDFWHGVAAGMHDRGFEFDVANFDTKFPQSPSQLIRFIRLYPLSSRTLNQLRDGFFEALPGELDEVQRIAARNEALIDSILSLTCTGVFVDSSKEYARFAYLRRSNHLDVRVIHLIRDVRGVVYSHLRRHEEMTAAGVARKWRKKHEWLEKNLALLPPGSWTQLRYEDLCRDVEGTLTRLYRFCGVDPEVKIPDYAAVPQHLIGNPMRLRFNSEIRLDERWRSKLTAAQLADIDRVAGALNRRYGYE